MEPEMLSYAALAFVALWAAMSTYDGIATAYDSEQRKTNWDYCRYSGSFRDVMAWWWRR
jgi:hypothetical protein